MIKIGRKPFLLPFCFNPHPSPLPNWEREFDPPFRADLCQTAGHNPSPKLGEGARLSIAQLKPNEVGPGG